MMPLLFKLAGIAVPGWFLMIFLPTWKWTRWVVDSFILPAIVAVLYLIGVVVVLSDTGVGVMMELGTADGVIRLLAQPDAALLAWIHFLAFDLIVGVMIFRDNLRHQIVPIPVQSVILFLTLMLGPLGFLSYWCARVVKLKKIDALDDGR